MAYFEGLPWLNQLHEINARAKAKFGRRYETVFSGLHLHETLENADYSSTPVNSSTFASTGGDGVHFSLVHINGKATDDSPVVMTCPMGVKFNVIVGSNLKEFLQLGCMVGFFQMEQLDWEPNKFFAKAAAIQQGDQKVLEEYAEEREPLQFLMNELSLEPISDIEAHLKRLKERFYPLLEFSSNDYLQSDQ